MKEFNYKYSTHGVTFYYFDDIYAARSFAEKHPEMKRYGTMVEEKT